MTYFYPCPACRERPRVGSIVTDEGPRPCARCWCALVIGRDMADLERRWNCLYCANDPATVEDEPANTLPTPHQTGKEGERWPRSASTPHTWPSRSRPG